MTLHLLAATQPGVRVVSPPPIHAGILTGLNLYRHQQFLEVHEDSDLVVSRDTVLPQPSSILLRVFMLPLLVGFLTIGWKGHDIRVPFMAEHVTDTCSSHLNHCPADFVC